MLGFSLLALQRYLRYLPIPAPVIDSIYARIAPMGDTRKRSTQDTPVNLSKMTMAINHLVALETELHGIQDAEREMDAVMEHFHALQEIFENTRKPVCKACSLSYMSSSPRRSD
jgi:hypothetical protein